MQLSNIPAKIPLPFASAGSKNTIPEASQIGITPGAASLTDGFPPLTRTPLVSGGVPPSGLDMNGILFELSAVIRWANAGGGYPFDSAFSGDANVGGYPKGARLLRSDGLGYWFNTADNNTVDPESAGAVAAGWVPDFTSGASAITMTNANVTLTNLQYGKPVIVITGALVSNLNLIFPAIVGEWVVINNTTGAFAITCKTASGTGVVVNSAQTIVGDGTNIYSATTDAIASLGQLVASAGGTADAITATFLSSPHSWANGIPFFIRAASANATTTPTITFNSGTLTAKTIVKGSNAALSPGDIAGAGHWVLMQYDTSLDKVILLNPATGVVASTNSPVVGATRNAKMLVTAASSSGTFTADELVVETALGGTSYKLSNYSQALNLATTGAGGMDTGAAPASGYVSIYAIAKADGTKNILACNVTTSTGNVYGGANMPSGYVASALVGIWPTNGSSQFVPGLIADPQGRKFLYQAYPSIFSANAAINTLTSQSISAGVPAAAKSADLILGTNYAGGQAQNPASVAADASGIGATCFDFINGTGASTMPGGMISMSGFAHFKDIPLLTSRTVFLSYGCTGSTGYCYVSGYSF